MKLQLIAFFLLLSGATIAQRTTITDNTTRNKVENQVTTLLTYASAKDYAGFTSNSVSRREDPAKKWKVAGDTANTQDVERSKEMIKKINNYLSNCADKKYVSFTSEKESEDISYVYTYQCREKKLIHFAFLKIKGNYLLEDIKVE